MAERPEGAGTIAKPRDGTVPQWKPPAGATRSRLVAEVSGYAHTLHADSASAGSSEALSVGDVVGERYLIEEQISAGGFGGVYRAADRQIRHHQVALKLLHAPAADERAQEAALHELAVIASVSHPSVVQFKDYGWHQGRLWFAMPWYKGETLAQRYAGQSAVAPLTRAVARPIFERIAQGLAAMHEVGIYHHDVKPDNVFVADIAGFPGGLPVLLDLGIAGTRGETPRGMTVEYAAPEVAAAALGNAEHLVGAAADVFSLALVLRNLLEPETAPATEGELLAMLHKRATVAVPELRRRELRYLRPSFARWLSLDPEKRPSASELASELAVLTQPEETREVRMRMLRRIVPVVIAATILVALLAAQVGKQKTQLKAERQRLSQQMKQSEELRKQSTDQLQELEQKSEQIGSQSRQLQRAIAIARQIDGQLTRAEERVDAANKKARKAEEERDAILLERDGLAKERDDLKLTRDRMSAERDGLSRERDALTAERDGLSAKRDELSRQRDAIEQDRNTLLAQRNDTIRQRDRLQSDLAAAQKLLESTRTERDELKTAYDQLKNEFAELKKQFRELRATRDQLDVVRKPQEPVVPRVAPTQP
ncbi:MAG: protein kinase [Polyangiales bacterium]